MAELCVIINKRRKLLNNYFLNNNVDNLGILITTLSNKRLSNFYI